MALASAQYIYHLIGQGETQNRNEDSKNKRMYASYSIYTAMYLYLYTCFCQGTPRNMRKYPNTGTVHHNPGMYI